MSTDVIGPWGRRVEMRLVSQGRAAEVAGLSRSEFIAALARFGVSPFQYSAEEIIEDARRE